MSKTKYLKGACQHCSGHLEFLADHIGMVVTCPHCQQETELSLLPPPEEPTVPRRALIWTAVAVIILGLGFAGALIALKRAERWARRQKQQQLPSATPAEPAPATGAPSTQQPNTVETNANSTTELPASNVTLEKTPGSSLVYAVGTIKNTSSHQRFGIKIELDLADATGRKIGTASDYRSILEPGAQWQFKALVVQPKAVSAKIASIREDQ